MGKIKKTDARIQQDVLNELKWDTRVEPTAIGVEVQSGVVTLTGAVSSWAKKVAAEEAAHRVAGVLDVANDVTVKAPGGARSDSDIAAAVRHALQWDVFVPDDNIQSTVVDGIVTLKGHVDTYAQRDDAGRAVRNLTGVHAVDNRLTVARPQVAPAELRAAIDPRRARASRRPRRGEDPDRRRGWSRDVARRRPLVARSRGGDRCGDRHEWGRRRRQPHAHRLTLSSRSEHPATARGARRFGRSSRTLYSRTSRRRERDRKNLGVRAVAPQCAAPTQHDSTCKLVPMSHE
jgi:osmotically-inducible protein OsmY